MPKVFQREKYNWCDYICFDRNEKSKRVNESVDLFYVETNKKVTLMWKNSNN